MRCSLLPTFLLATCAAGEVEEWTRRHRHHHHGVSAAVDGKNTTAEALMKKIRKVVKELDEKEGEQAPAAVQTVQARGRLEVNAPLPRDFAERFAEGAAAATGCDPKLVKLLSTSPVPEVEGQGRLAEITFEAPLGVVKEVEMQSQDPDSKLASGTLCPFLVARDNEGGLGGQCGTISTLVSKTNPHEGLTVSPGPAPEGLQAEDSSEGDEESDSEKEDGEAEKTSAMSRAKQESRLPLDVDTDLPFGDLEPFGREDTAQELTEAAIKESDEMVDQLERAEVAEEKRAVFRALTRLRGAAITSFDGIARSQTSNIDEYSKVNKWRKHHPLHHLAQAESDISKWAFPDF